MVGDTTTNEVYNGQTIEKLGIAWLMRYREMPKLKRATSCIRKWPIDLRKIQRFWQSFFQQLCSTLCGFS